MHLTWLMCPGARGAFWRRALRVLFLASLLCGQAARGFGQADLLEDPLLDREATYERYLAPHVNAPRPELSITTAAARYDRESGAGVSVLPELQGERDVLQWKSESGWVEWDVAVPQSGLYTIELRYLPLPGRSRNIEIGLSVDGSSPFLAAQKIELYRTWKDGEPIPRDNRGNDIRPRQVEEPRWIDGDLRDTEGLHSDSYQFYLDRGPRTIRISAVREPFALKHLRLYNTPAPPAYAGLRESYERAGYGPAPPALVKVQAEVPWEKSDPVLHPVYDRSSPATEPYHFSKIRLNVLGGVNWRYPGQWLTWRFTVPADGLYVVALRYKQDAIRGFFTSRRILIDGLLPCAEMASVRFPYDTRWGLKVLGDDDPYLLYLREGEHEITMEVTLGEMAQTLRTVEEAVYTLNYIYRRIIMITGANPDPYRDYYLDREIPDLIGTFERVAQTLSDEERRLEAVTGHVGTEAALLQQIAVQLRSLTEKPDTIAERLSNYRDNVTALGAWILRIKEQPLLLDYLLIASPQSPLPRPRAGLLRTVVHEIRAFVASFVEDYNSVGNVFDPEQSVKVWVGLGRDQAQIIKSMIDDLFTPQTGITVNLSLVQGALVQATMAGKGPDVALNVGRGEPVNLAVRGAVAPLDGMAGFDEVRTRFMPSALLPYEFGGHVYALPETQSFLMLFYRRDIFAELGIRPPQTWEELYHVMPVIQKNNMEVGLPYTVTDAWNLVGMGMGAQTVFPALLFQHGGGFYTPSHEATELDEPEAIAAFKEWTDFYTHYSFPLIYDFYNRFRTGQMPLGIQHYTFYNLLSVAAPELRNLWDMVPIPGTRREDGGIDRSQGASGSAGMILDRARNKQAAWEFLEWWTDAAAQSRYGREQEAIMGPAARYNPANVEAFDNMPWADRERRNLMEQWRQVREVPEVPGGYYTARNVDNAFRTVVFNWANAREVLFYWNKETNKEILRKRVEFGIE